MSHRTLDGEMTGRNRGGSLPVIRSLALAATVLGTAATAGAQTNDQVKALIAQLGNDDFSKREQAQAQLLNYLEKNVLTPDQLGLVQVAATSNADLEIKKRAGNVMATWANTVPAVRTLLNDFFYQETAWDKFPNKGYSYRIDSFYGIGIRNEDPLESKLEKLSTTAKNAVLKGATADVTPNLKTLRDFVKGLNAADFNKLGLYEDPAFKQKATQAEVVQKLTDAVNDAKAAIDAIGKGTNTGALLTEQKTLVQNIGPIGGGAQTLQLSLLDAKPITAGFLSISSPPTSLASFVTPPGFIIIGQVHEATADDSLAVSGRVGLQFVYGPMMLVGNPPLNPDTLEIARIANGAFDILPVDSNDLATFTITSHYTPDSGSSGLNQFGAFALLESVPEPSSFVLCGVGSLVLLTYATCRKLLRPRVRDKKGIRKGRSHSALRASKPHRA
jgi:hypothetical protein